MDIQPAGQPHIAVEAFVTPVGVDTIEPAPRTFPKLPFALPRRFSGFWGREDCVDCGRHFREFISESSPDIGVIDGILLTDLALKLPTSPENGGPVLERI